MFYGNLRSRAKEPGYSMLTFNRMICPSARTCEILSVTQLRQAA